MKHTTHSAWFVLLAIACGNGSDEVDGSSGGLGGLAAGPTGGLGGALTGGALTGGTGFTGGMSGVPTGGVGTGSGPGGGTSGSGGLQTGGTGGLGTGGTTGGTGNTGGIQVTGGTGGLGASGSGGAITGGASGGGGTPPTGGVAGSGSTPPTGGASGGGTPLGGAGGDGGVMGSGGSESGGTGGGTVACGTTATPGEIITFNDDGGWCWYQDERVIVDPNANKLVIGSVAIQGSRNGNVEVTMYNLDGSGSPQRTMLGDLNPDDHNTSGLLKIGEGKYLAFYTTHNDDCYSYYNIFQNGSWGAQNKFSWSGHGCPTDNGKTVSYSNLWHMGDQLYNFVRSTETSPNLITSTDGANWTYSGRLTSTDRVGYVAGYYKYWGNNVDRIDFVGTEAHPRDFDNSLYHGYVQDGKVHNSTGTPVDNNLLDGNAQNITAYTKVFGTGARLGSVTLTHLWNCDLMRYPDGTIVLIFTGRANGDTNDPDKRFGYARFDGTSWKSTYLVKAGHKLYDSEQDYTGLGAVHPTNPNTIYISTTTDPRDDTTAFNKHEIWRGTTCDGGQTFEWTPITQNSNQDNLRPVVPYWESEKTVLLWMRGTYHTAQTYDTDIVGVIMDGP
ncbi:MAG: hypothetical protein JW751_03575 [Polyangiaceae bacterium]|nr:hypothetical protein [Polyangiaceae bacterium]